MEHQDRLGATQTPTLTRGIGLAGATAANMLEMIGVGPFITIPILLSKMNGPQAILGWFLGAIVALCDGLVWAELGAAMPGSGGPYRYLSEAYGPRGLGRMMSFLFIWETVFLAPLSIGSGAVGFAQYTKFLVKDLSWWHEKGIAMAVCVAITTLLYRDIRSVGRLSVTMWIVVLALAAWITMAGLLNFSPQRVLDFPADAFTASPAFFLGLGGATLIAMYDYGGYNNVCFFAGEVRSPEKRDSPVHLDIGGCSCGIVSDDEHYHHRSGSMARSHAFDVDRFRLHATNLWQPCGPVGDRTRFVDNAGFVVRGTAGLLSGALRSSGGRAIFQNLRQAPPQWKLPDVLNRVHRDHLRGRLFTESRSAD